MSICVFIPCLCKKMGKKANKHLKIVSFDEEIINKDCADKLLSKSGQNIEVTRWNKSIVGSATIPEHESRLSDINLNSTNEAHKTEKSKIRKKKKSVSKEQMQSNGDQESLEEIKVKRKKKKPKTNERQSKNEQERAEDTFGNVDENREDRGKDLVEKNVKRKKKVKLNEVETIEEPGITDDVSVESKKVKTGESIRAQKRKKYMKLLEEKRLKVELGSQQNALNYLSKWKHCRNEWKFEKLKQIWLQQNLFDIDKIPNEFWETVVSYFGSSKGSIRTIVLKDALKIIEKEESVQGENTDESYLLTLQRARDVVQHLQE